MAGMSPQETDQLVNDALSRRDVDAMLDLFEPNAVFIDPESGIELRGHQAIREAVTSFFEADVTLQGEEPRVIIADDVALVISEWTMEVQGLDGDTIRQSGTATDVMRRQPDGTWRYVIDNPGGTARASGP